MLGQLFTDFFNTTSGFHTYNLLVFQDRVVKYMM